MQLRDPVVREVHQVHGPDVLVAGASRQGRKLGGDEVVPDLVFRLGVMDDAVGAGGFCGVLAGFAHGRKLYLIISE